MAINEHTEYLYPPEVDEIMDYIHSSSLELAREGNVRLELHFDVDDPHEGIVFYKVTNDGGKTFLAPISSLIDAVESYNREVASARR